MDTVQDIPQELKSVFGDDAGFAVAEAYKTLRANLMFTLPDEGGCRILGVTSAQRGDGKSTTALNLAYSLMQSGKKVLFIEGDMRLPTLAGKLRIPSTPGLSNLLISSDFSRSLALSQYMKTTLFFLSAGDIPPNPSELLGSRAMRELLVYYAEAFEFILIDLPPVLAVSDALVASKLINGILFVVRHDQTERGQILEAIRQIRLGGTKILGFVYNCASESSGGYRKKYRNYYHKYYRYGSRSGSGTGETGGTPSAASSAQAPRRAK